MVSAEEDFTSVLWPFLARRELEVELVPLDDVAEAIDARTALVAVSAVQSVDGRVADLDAITAAAAHHGALTYLDATQAAGWLPLDAGRFDYLAASGYKWLMNPRGTAFFAIRPEAAERLQPHLAGWYAGDDPVETNYGAPAAAGRRRPPLRRLARVAELGRRGARRWRCSRTSASTPSTRTTSGSRTASAPASGCRRATRRSSPSSSTPPPASGCAPPA